MFNCFRYQSRGSTKEFPRYYIYHETRVDGYRVPSWRKYATNVTLVRTGYFSRTDENPKIKIRKDPKRHTATLNELQELMAHTSRALHATISGIL